MHVLLTGGTGFFGKALLRHWHETSGGDLRVTIVTRYPERLPREMPELADGIEWLQFRHGDVTKPHTLPASGDFTHIIHAATGRTDGSNGHLGQYADSVEGTRNVMDLAVKLGVKRILLTSSGAVYGRLPAEVTAVSEEFRGAADPLDVANSYALGKLASEHICALWADRYGLEPVVARCFSFSGRDLVLHYNFAIGNFVRDAVSGGQIIVNGDGSAVRSYLDQRELAHWLMVMLTDGAPGRAYNVGSDQPVTIAELAALVAKTAGREGRVTIKGNARLNSGARYVPAIDRAREELGLSVTIDLESSVRYMIERAANQKGQRV